MLSDTGAEQFYTTCIAQLTEVQTKWQSARAAKRALSAIRKASSLSPKATSDHQLPSCYLGLPENENCLLMLSWMETLLSVGTVPAATPGGKLTGTPGDQQMVMKPLEQDVGV